MLRLTTIGTTTIPVEAEVIRPDNLMGKTCAEIAALPVQHGNAAVALGEFFRVEGSADDGAVIVEGDCSRVKLLGAGMTSGSLTVHGDVGMHLGAEMTGGEIRVHGNAADWVGAEMRGGKIHVHGSAGHLVGAAYRGSRYGMRGGAILIDGKAGHEVGVGMRRGLVVVGGAGDFAGASLIAGTVFVFGPSGLRAGAGMKRGTVAFFGPPPEILGTFRWVCTYEPVWVALYLRRLRAWGYPGVQGYTVGRWRRYCGDLVSLGKGEILVREGRNRGMPGLQ
jgi:formylmethanofuran dehydrogenase subunit C